MDRLEIDPKYNYQPYETPRNGIFNITTNDYRLGFGWIQRQDKILIIGETDDSYVYKLQESGHGEWVGNKVIQKRYILPHGIHKSRFVKWTETQLSLF